MRVGLISPNKGMPIIPGTAHYRWLIVLLLVLCFGSASWAQTADGVILTGRYRLRLQANNVQGDLAQYHLDTGLDPGSWLTQTLVLSGFGPLNGGWYFNGRYDAELPVPDRLELRINKAANELFAGTRRFTAPSSGLLQWGRLLTGVQAAAVTDNGGRFGIRAAIGDPLGIPARDEIPGKGLVGPYLLASYHLPAVPESETVTVDGIPQRRDVDYEIDYDLGTLTFRVPVPESSQIVVDYEYQAPQPRRTSAVLGRLKESNLTLDILAGEEHSLEDNPLVYVPPEGTDESDVLPDRQHMVGGALTWAATKDFTLNGSWLGTSSTVWEGDTQAAAWQAGGEWHGDRGKAGWDYRRVMDGFRPIGKPAEDGGYQALSAGYEYTLAGPWHSKLNMEWRAPLEPAHANDQDINKGQVEHVLTYSTGKSAVGWSLDWMRHMGENGAYQMLTSGFLGATHLGQWDVELERKGIVAGTGWPDAGDQQAFSRIDAHLTENPALNGELQWKQELQYGLDTQKNRSTVWRAILASKSSGDGMLVDNQNASWRMQWMQSWQETGLPADLTAPAAITSQVNYGRVEATLPLWHTNLLADMLAETRSRVYAGDQSLDNYLKTGLHYYRGIRWDAYIAAQQSLFGLQQPEQRQLAAGTSLSWPLLAGWSYEGDWQAFAEATDTDDVVEFKQMHGLAWHNSLWRIGADWTTGLLAEPAQPGEEDDEEDGVEQQPLAQLPVGHRYSVHVDRNTPAARISAMVARDIESAARAWSGDLQVTVKAGTTNITGQFSGSVRNGPSEWSWEQTGKLGIEMWLGQTLFSVYGRTDVRQSLAGTGDYRANGLFSEWTARF